MKFKLLQLFKILSKLTLYIFIAQCATLSFALATETKAQRILSVRDVEISILSQKPTIESVFEEIETKTDFKFSYDKRDLKSRKNGKINLGTQSVADLLLKVSENSNLQFRQVNDVINVMKMEENSEKIPLKVTLEDITISGRVTDDQGLGLPGVSIAIKGTTLGVVTDIDGGYQVNLDENAVLVFSSLGFEKQEVTVASRTVIDVILKDDAATLNEVVVVGYGKTSRKRITGAVTKIDTKVLQSTQNVSFADALIGIVPGLLVEESFINPDTPPKILLRGVGSINSSTEPLIVIDGVQMPTGLNASTINTNDIKDISVLKDAAATTIYGSRGSNGVILITTKRGKRNSELQVTLNTRTSFRSPIKSFTDDILNTTQKLDYEESLGFYDADPTLLAERRASGNNTDWSDLLIDNETSQSYDVGLSGGGENSSFYASISYNTVDNLVGSEYERYTANVKTDFYLNHKLSLALSGNFGNVNNRDRRSVGDPFESAFLLNPWEQVFDQSTGEPLRNITFGAGFGDPLNPLFVRNNTNILSKRKNIGGSADLNYQPLEWLNLRAILGANYNNSQSTNYSSVILNGGNLETNNGNDNNYTSTLTATIDKSVNKHDFTLVLGNEYNENESYGILGTARGFNSDAVQVLNASTRTPRVFESKSHAGSLSYFSRLNYSFDNTLNLSLSYRRDGSSKFGDNNRYANFWAAGASWNMFKNVFSASSLVDNLKLRISTGSSGNDFIDDFASQSLYDFRINYDGAGVASLSRGDNPNLTWEKNTNSNIGLDFGLLNNRVTGSVEYYIKDTKNLINNVPISFISGFGGLVSNIGEFRNQGVEIALQTTNVKSTDFTWSTTFNLAHNKGEVVKLTTSDLILRGNGTYNEGSPIGALYMVDWAGVNPATGFNQYRDTEGSLVDYDPNFGGNQFEISELREVTDKNSIPVYHGGITNNFTYKNFDISFLVSFAGGNYTIHDGQFRLRNTPVNNQHKDVLNAWQNPGDQTGIAVRVIDPFNPVFSNQSDFQQSSQFLQDASYIKLKNFVIGYSLNSDLVNKIGMQSLRIFAQGQNLITITDVDYVDPEFTNQGSTTLSSSILRGFSFGINANF